MIEEWRPISGYEGLYEVSNLGRVRRLTTVNGYQAGSIRGGTPNAHGHFSLALSKRGDHRAYFVHRLVAEAFLGPSPEGLCVNHKDGNKQNNRADNLEYATIAENNLHAQRLGLTRHACGTTNGRSKLTDEAVTSIRRELTEGIRPPEIARRFQVSTSTIRAIRSGKTWRHLPDPGPVSTPPPLIQPAQGSQRLPAKLTEEDVRLIRALRESGIPVIDVRRQFHIGDTTVWSITARRSWKHVK